MQVEGRVSERLAGYQDALVESGVAVDPRLICRVEIDPEAAAAATRRLLDRRSRPTAIFAYNDLKSLERLFTDLVNMHHVFVPDSCRGTGFAHEPFASGRQNRHMRGHHLDRHHTLQDSVEA